MKKFLFNWWQVIGFTLMILLLATIANAQNTWMRTRYTTNNPDYNPTKDQKVAHQHINTATGSVFVWDPPTKEWIIQSYKYGSAPDTVFIIDTVFVPVMANDILLQLGAVYSNKTLKQLGYSQAQVDSKFPGIGAKVDDQADWAAMQLAVVRYKCIDLYGDLYLNRSIVIPDDKSSLVINGRGYALNATTSNSFTFIGRIAPIDNGDANLMVDAKYIIRDLWINGNGNQYGIALGPGYGHLIENCRINNVITGNHYRFALKSGIDNCEANSVQNGFIFDHGNWPGATTSNSQSNSSWMNNSRVYFNQSGNIGTGVYAASGFNGSNHIYEGHTCRMAFEFDSKGATVVRDGRLTGVHYEVVNNPAKVESAFKIRLTGGMFNLDNIFGQHPAMLIDGSSTSGSATIKLTDLAYWRSGKIFKSSNVSWQLADCEFESGQISSSNFQSLFSGTAPQPCNGAPGCGYNRFTVSPTPR